MLSTAPYPPAQKAGFFVLRRHTMQQIPVKSTCSACGGGGLLPTGAIYTLGGREHPVLHECIACEGKGTLLNWVEVHELAQMLQAIEVEQQAE
jgi:hypothetical protein